MKQIITPTVVIRWFVVSLMLIFFRCTEDIEVMLFVSASLYFFYELYWYLWREAVENNRDIVTILGDKMLNFVKKKRYK